MHDSAEQIFADIAAHPTHQNGRLLVFAIRRMAVGGLHDAHATHAVLAHFGLGYRRPLILMRAMMAEIARASQQTIKIAPCCCLRMTGDEAALLQVIEQACGNPHGAHAMLQQLMGTDACLGVLTTAQAVAQAFHDLGRPLALFGTRSG